MMTKTTTSAPAPRTAAPDPIAAALAAISDAGIDFVEVDRCPDATCPTCADPALPTAA